MRRFVSLLIFMLLWAVNSEAGGRLTFQPYVFRADNGQTVDAELGTLRVIENRNQPGSREIQLALVRFRSTSPNPGAPIVYLAGGPGGSGIEAARSARFPLFMELRQAGDVIAFDQRGTGMSLPNLNCPGKFHLPADRALNPDQVIQIWGKRLSACAGYWRKQGVDLSAYNTNESADDLESLRQELGASKLRLWGISYGTHLALAAIKRHEASIQSAILAGVEGPDQTLKLPSAIQKKLLNVARLIRADPEASKAVPDFIGSVRTVMEHLQRHPESEIVQDPKSGKPVHVEVGAFDFQSLLSRNLDPASLPYLPQAFSEMSHGNFQTLARLTLGEREEGLGSAMAYAMDCASGASPARWKRILREEKITLLGRSIDFPFPEICEAIGVQDLGAAYRSAVHSQIPVLFISGTLDQRTPLRNAIETGKGFPHKSMLLIVNGGHDDLLQSSPWIQQTMLEFLQGMPLSTSRIQLPPVHFLPVNRP